MAPHSSETPGPTAWLMAVLWWMEQGKQEVLILWVPPSLTVSQAGVQLSQLQPVSAALVHGVVGS